MTLIIGQFTTLYNVWFSEFPSSITILLGNLLNYTLVIFFANYNKIFHKTEVQTYILRCWKVLNHKWFKSYNIITKKRKKHQKRKKREKKHQIKEVFFTNSKKLESEMFAFWVITLEPNMIPTCSELQNDC